MRKVAVKILLQITLASLILLLAEICHAAGSTTVSVSATVLSKSICKFMAASAALNFGSLDPANSSDAIINSTITFRCVGSVPNATFSISQDDGLHETGPGANRMQNTTVTTEYLPYTITLNPLSSTVPKNVVQTLTISGSIQASDYQNAYIGSYSDTVVISIAP